MALRKCCSSVAVGVFLALVQGSAAGRSQRIAGIAIDRADSVYVWWKDGVVTTGTRDHFEARSHARAFKIPDGETVNDIVAMSMSPSDDRVYAWYKDGRFSVGSATDLAKYVAPQPVTLPAGLTTAAIAGIGIAENGRVYTWYENLTYTIGRASRLDSHQGPRPYSLPPAKIPTQLLELDFARSNGRVHAWYNDGSGSIGNAQHLDVHRPYFEYTPSQVLYQWWGPAPAQATSSHSGMGSLPIDIDDDAERPRRRAGRTPQPRPAGDPGEPDGVSFSPAFSASFQPAGLGAPDLSIAVGNRYLLLANTGTISFYDNSGKQLAQKNGVQTSFGTKAFFNGFLSKTTSDGTWNENNINLYMRLGKPCDSPDFPQLAGGAERFCVSSFYDTRVFYDASSARFFIIANARHNVWNKDCGLGDGTHCGCIKRAYADEPDPSRCWNEDAKQSGVCQESTDALCGLGRRFTAFAVSKSEDPRDGFHQYMIAENNPHDWPWEGVNGDHFVVAYNGVGQPELPVATVFSVNAIKSGVVHPPFFRYYRADTGGVTVVRPVMQYGTKAGLTYLVGSGADHRIDVFAFPQSIDPWSGPRLQKTSVTIQSTLPHFYNGVFRSNHLYLVGDVHGESKTAKDDDGKDVDVTRKSVHVLRIPVEPISGFAIKASNDPAKGFLDASVGKRAPTDPPDARLSYESSSIAVNQAGDMLLGYCRRPFASEPPLIPEARYSVWYAGESNVRRSWLLQAGNGSDPDADIDFTTSVVDPDDKTFWVALPFANSGAFSMVVGQISP